MIIYFVNTLLKTSLISAFVSTFQTKTTEISPSFPFLNEVLYESDYSSQMWQVYDAQKRFVYAGDYKTEKSAFKAEKGDYQLFLLVKNHSQAQLERLKDMMLLLAMKQANNIPIDFYPSLPHLSVNMKFSAMTPFKSSVRSVYVVGPPEEKVPKLATPGSFLVGTISFHQHEKWKKAITYPLKIGFADAPPKRATRKAKGGGGGCGSGSSTSSGGAGDSEKPSVLADLKESIRSLRIGALQKLEKEEEKAAFFEELCKDFGADDPELCYARLLSLDAKCRGGADVARSFVRLADVLTKAFANDELAHYCVSKEETYDAKLTAKMEKQKTQLSDALLRSGTAVCVFLQGCANAEVARELMGEAEKMFCQAKKWCDLREPKLSAFLIEYFLAKGLDASALKLLLKALDEKCSKETEQRVIQVTFRE